MMNDNDFRFSDYDYFLLSEGTGACGIKEACTVSTFCSPSGQVRNNSANDWQRRKKKRGHWAELINYRKADVVSAARRMALQNDQVIKEWLF
jgi:hypothetical protein